MRASLNIVNIIQWLWFPENLLLFHLFFGLVWVFFCGVTFLSRMGKFYLYENCVMFKLKADNNKKREGGIKGNMKNYLRQL